MTVVDDLVLYYQNLLIKQYHDKPNAKATIDAVARQLLADWVYIQVRDAFDIDTSVGVQLDVIGKYEGLDRKYLVDQTDNSMRFLLKMKIIQNTSNHSYESIDDYVEEYFSGTIEVEDNLDMTISYLFPFLIFDIMNQALQTNSLPRPLGVGIILWGILNPNGTFGFSFGAAGAYDPLINGYGFQTYEGGTYLKYAWYG